MNFSSLFQQLIAGIAQTKPLEFIAVITGIWSVLLSRKEHIAVYPVGLISTFIYIYICIKGNLFGEASVNVYYTLMSFYGWYCWKKKSDKSRKELQITFSNTQFWVIQIAFCLVCYIVFYEVLSYLKLYFAPGVLPLADAFATATAFTGMWLMARKKVESWFWWLLTNIASIPLYFIKGYVFSSFQFLIFLILSILGGIEWYKKGKLNRTINH